MTSDHRSCVALITVHNTRSPFSSALQKECRNSTMFLQPSCTCFSFSFSAVSCWCFSTSTQSTFSDFGEIRLFSARFSCSRWVVTTIACLCALVFETRCHSTALLKSWTIQRMTNSESVKIVTMTAANVDKDDMKFIVIQIEHIRNSASRRRQHHYCWVTWIIVISLDLWSNENIWHFTSNIITKVHSVQCLRLQRHSFTQAPASSRSLF